MSDTPTLEYDETKYVKMTIEVLLPKKESNDYEDYNKKGKLIVDVAAGLFDDDIAGGSYSLHVSDDKPEPPVAKTLSHLTVIK